MPRPLARVDSLRTGVAGIVLFMGTLLAISLFLRTRALGASLWMDEGLSIGIASQPFFDIPGVLRQDGSPPLYYLMLHVWMNVVGSGPGATQGLSVAISLLAVPAGLWAGWTLFGKRTGLICAALAAFNPFLTYYAQETRMYSLMIVLSLLTTAAFLHVYVYRNRRYLALFTVSLAALLYVHSWGIFVTVGTLAALVPALRAREMRAPLLKDIGLGYGLGFVGPVATQGLMDWRDAQERLEAATPEQNLTPLLDELPVARRVLLVHPVTSDAGDWNAPWIQLVRRRQAQWGQAMELDDRFIPRAGGSVLLPASHPDRGARGPLPKDPGPVALLEVPDAKAQKSRSHR